MKRSAYLLLALGALLIISGWFVNMRFSGSNSAQEPVPIPTPVATPSGIRSFDLVIKGNKLVLGPEVITLREGDEVVLNITSDADEELHLHGYDLSVDLKAGQQATLKLQANVAGRFVYELENSKVELGALEVQPQ